MPICQIKFGGEDYIGLFGFATDSYCLVSNRLSKNKYDRLARCLEVDIIPTTVSAFSLSGVMSAGNSNGVAVPYMVTDSEIEEISKAVKKVKVVPDRFTALGNLVAANDKGGVISDVFSAEAKEVIDSALGFETVQRKIGGSSEVGALCVATNKGFVVTPDASDKEMEELKGIFGVEGGRASANMGSKAVGCCIIANSNGFAAGEATTPIELGLINEALGFL